MIKLACAKRRKPLGFYELLKLPESGAQQNIAPFDMGNWFVVSDDSCPFHL
jgi:hypothetical protein